MNLAIRECSRKHHQDSKSNRKSSSSIPNFSRIAQDLGFRGDGDDLKAEAENMWAMLTDLHESDPAGYRSFIDSQMKAATEHAKKSSQEGSTSSQRYFTPEKGFVVQTVVEKSSVKELVTPISLQTVKNTLPGYVNFCHHKAIEIPKDSCSGKQIDISNTSMDFTRLQVPLVISQVRTVKLEENMLKGSSGSSGSAVAIDVVFHPWCFERWNKNDSFKNEIYPAF